MAFRIFTVSCNHHHNQFQNIFIPSKRNSTPLSYGSPHTALCLSNSRQLLTCFLCLDLPVLDISYKRDGNHLVHSSLWLASFTSRSVFKVSSRCSTCQHFISFYCWMILCCTDVPHFPCPFSNWWASEWSPLFVCWEYDAMNAHVQVFVWTCVFIFLGCVPGSGIDGPMVTCLILRGINSCQSCLQRLYCRHPHQQCRRLSGSPGPQQHLLLSVCLVTAILAGVKWYIWVLLCIFDVLGGGGACFRLC